MLFTPYIRTNQAEKDENEPGVLTEEDWERLNNLIGFKEGDDKQSLIPESGDLPHILLKLHMRHNASKLIDFQECLADLSCENLDCCVKLYSEAKVFDIKLGSYRLLSPNGLLAEVGCLNPSYLHFYWHDYEKLLSSIIYQPVIAYFSVHSFYRVKVLLIH